MFDDDARWQPVEGYRPHELEEFDEIVDRVRQQHDPAAGDRPQIAEEDAALD